MDVFRSQSLVKAVTDHSFLFCRIIPLRAYLLLCNQLQMRPDPSGRVISFVFSTCLFSRPACMNQLSFTVSAHIVRVSYDSRLAVLIISHEFVQRVSLCDVRLVTWNTPLTLLYLNSAFTVPLSFRLSDAPSGVDVIVGDDYSVPPYVFYFG